MKKREMRSKRTAKDKKKASKAFQAIDAATKFLISTSNTWTPTLADICLEKTSKFWDQ